MPLYWILAFIIGWGCALPNFLRTEYHAALPVAVHYLTVAAYFAPALAAIAVSATQGELRRILTAAARFRAPLWCYAVAVAFAVAWTQIEFSAINLNDATPQLNWANYALVTSLWVLFGFGLELGWRAYALPRLVARYGFWLGSTLLGIGWFAWSLGAFRATDYVRDLVTSGDVSDVALFFAHVMTLNFGLCWLYRASGGTLAMTVIVQAALIASARDYPRPELDYPVTLAVAGLLGFAVLLEYSLKRKTAA